jgi:hypothetical protein
MRILSKGIFASSRPRARTHCGPAVILSAIPPVSIVIPTRGRPAYLEVALASIAPQAAAAGAEVLVVDDAGSSPAVRALAERFGARYEPHPGPLGLNVARNTGVAHSRGELVAFVDDDVEVDPGWLEALLRAAREHPRTQVFTGPIRPRLEGRGGWGRRSCGREGPPITALDLGLEDTDRVRYAWGVNMAVRRGALERVGPFDVTIHEGGDEQEWQDRMTAVFGGTSPSPARSGSPSPIDPQDGRSSPSADGHVAGGRVLYVAAASLRHRRAGPDARLRALARTAHARGRAARRFDASRGQAPSLGRELRTLGGCMGHVVRYRCPAGLTMVAHSLGRLAEGTKNDTPLPPSTNREGPPEEDFLSGESGTVGGLDGLRRRARDELVDALEVAGGRRRRLDRAAGDMPPRRRVLVLGVQRPEHGALAEAIRTELARSRHDVELRFGPPGEMGKFENLNRLLAANPYKDHDWLLVVDDDVILPRGFLDHLLFLAERFALDLAQPAHRAYSHAAWRVTRRRPGAVARETAFVEIGPVTAFARATFRTLVPFPSLRMGWGLDLHWAALARERGWRRGVLDAVAIGHAAAPAADAYSREAAVAEARAFLAERPYLSAAEAQRTLATHWHW